MKSATKIWLVVATSLVLVGCILFGGAMSMVKWNFSKLQTAKFETNEYDVPAYYNISIQTDTADIEFVPSESDQYSVVCYEQKNAKHSVSVKDGTLVIELVDTKKWYEYIGIAFATPKITVYVPQGEYGALSIKSSTGDVEIPKGFQFDSMYILENTGDVAVHASVLDSVKMKTNTGDIRLENASAGSLQLSVSTGKITVDDVTCEGNANLCVSTGKTDLNNFQCKNLTSTGDTGDITLHQVIAGEKISLHRSTGDIKFDGADAAEVFVKTDTGDVTGTFLSEKIFFAETDTGRIDVPKSTSGGKCEVKTNTGDIKLSIS